MFILAALSIVSEVLKFVHDSVTSCVTSFFLFSSSYLTFLAIIFACWILEIFFPPLKIGTVIFAVISVVSEELPFDTVLSVDWYSASRLTFGNASANLDLISYEPRKSKYNYPRLSNPFWMFAGSLHI